MSDAEVAAAAKRLYANRDYQTVMRARLVEINGVILSTPMDKGVDLSNALHAYHSTVGLQDYVESMARDAENG